MEQIERPFWVYAKGTVGEQAGKWIFFAACSDMKNVAFTTRWLSERGIDSDVREQKAVA